MQLHPQKTNDMEPPQKKKTPEEFWKMMFLLKMGFIGDEVWEKITIKWPLKP